MTTLRVLTPEEIAVFDQIVTQREKKGPNQDYFIYFAGVGQEGLQSSGEATSCGVGIHEQVAIIHKLAEDKLIEADWITSRNASDFVFRYHDYEWMKANYSAYDWSWLIFDGDDYDNCFFMHLGFDRIKVINDNCKAIYPCELFYDEEQCCFCVSSKDTNRIYPIDKLRSGMKPFKVLLATFKTSHKCATRAWLNGDKKTNIGRESLASRVFAKNSVVRNELSPFVTLKTDSITIKTDAMLTLNQLEALEKA